MLDPSRQYEQDGLGYGIPSDAPRLPMQERPSRDQQRGIDKHKPAQRKAVEKARRNRRKEGR